MSEVQNPHDQFVKLTLSDKETATSFLENYLPPRIVAKLDFTNLEILQESFVDEDFQAHHTEIGMRKDVRTLSGSDGVSSLTNLELSVS